MRFTLFCLLVSLSILVGCSKPVEPTVERIDNVELLTMSKDNVDLTADMILHNANAFALDLSQADLVAMVDEIEVATISQSYDTTMPAQSDFAMPIRVQMDLKKLYGDSPLAAMGKALQVMADRRLDVRFVGVIKAGKGVAKVSIPVDQVESVSF